MRRPYPKGDSSTTGEWKVAGVERLRPSAKRALVALIDERGFTYARYDELLARLQDRDHYLVLPLREIANASGDRVVVGLRHDVDSRLENALAMGRLEYRRGLSATYFVLHTARYYRHDSAFLRALRTLQDDYGHEIGWHNDLVTLECIHGIDAVRHLRHELEWLRLNSIAITGTAAHGARACYEFGYSNLYFFADFPAVDPLFPNRETIVIDGRRVSVPSAYLADFGLEYEATQLRRDHYFSDATFDSRGHRWHPSRLPEGILRPGDKTIILVHPCLWESSAVARIGRESVRLAGRALTLARSSGPS